MKTYARKVTIGISALGVLLVCAVLFFLFRYPGPPKGSVAAKGAAPERAALATHPSARPKIVPSSDGVTTAKAPTQSTQARSLYLDEKKPLADRFNELAALAETGDLSARQFTLEIATQCRAWSLPPDQAERATLKAAALRALEELSSQCQGVLAAPAYAEMVRILKSNPAGVFDQDTRQIIRELFANQGAQGALQASVSALYARPDESTIATINETLGNLDVSTIYTEPLMQSTTALNPDKRQQLLQYALNLLACDYGRPCGPGSDIVLSYCAGMNVCMPGAGLEQLYKGEMLSGEDMRDVDALLNMLKQYTPWDNWTQSE